MADMLTPKCRKGLERALRLGCFVRLLPYRWKVKKQSQPLSPGAESDLSIFHFHQSVMTCYTTFMVFRFAHANSQVKDFPLQQKLLAALWTFAFLVTTVGFFQLNLRRREIMQLANLLLQMKGEGSLLPASAEVSMDRLRTYQLSKIDKYGRKMFSWHVYIAMFLLFSNPGVHTLITYQSPCAPHFISSSILKCRFIAENIYTAADKAPFAVFELYSIFMFLYICFFLWTFIVFGLSYVANELRKMRRVTVKMVCNSGKWQSILHSFRRLELLVILINDIFRYYLMVFSSILFFIVSMLIFGTIRLWYIDPQSNLMFPLCAMRCGFEAVTPLAVAGNVNKQSKRVLEKWRKTLQALVGTQTRTGMRYMKMCQRSCRGINCTAGSLYTFEHSIVLCSINNCFQMTLNLLVTFGKDT